MINNILDTIPENNEQEKTINSLKELTEEQKSLILKAWNESSSPPSISSLIKIVFPLCENIDPRTSEGILIKKFLTSIGITNLKTNVKEKKPEIILTQEQKDYISNNCSNMKCVEMARVLFNNNNLFQTSLESRTIFNYVKSLNKETKTNNEDIPEQDYLPPKTLDRVCAKINKYVKEANLDFRNLKIVDKRRAESLISYLHNYRFIYQMNSYDNESDRVLFESAFVEYTWDKDDLSSEDIDQYIILCNEKIMAASILKNINQLQSEQERIIQTENKMSMTHVEALKSARTEYNDCVKRQQNLYRSLIQERSNRILDQKENLSLLNFFQLWTEEESRNKIVKLAIERQEKLSEEIDKLATMDGLLANINGISKEEILYG